MRSFGSLGLALARRIHHLSLRLRGFGQAKGNTSGEYRTLALLSKTGLAVDVIFDVGANVGDWSVAARRNWETATIYAFEPSVAVYQELKSCHAGPPFEPERAALGDKVGEQNLYAVEGLPGLSSLHRRDLRNVGLEMSLADSVPVTTLDAFCSSRGVPHIDLLKIDVEGHELAVLRGGSGMLENGSIDLIQFEFGGTNIDSRTFLRDFIYILADFDLFRITSRGLEPVRYSEREEVFVTTNFLAVRVSSPWRTSLFRPRARAFARGGFAA